MHLWGGALKLDGRCVERIFLFWLLLRNDFSAKLFCNTSRRRVEMQVREVKAWMTSSLGKGGPKQSGSKARSSWDAWSQGCREQKLWAHCCPNCPLFPCGGCPWGAWPSHVHTGAGLVSP